MATLRLISVAWLLATSACSWATMTRPPSIPVEPVPAAMCTTSRVAPGLDTAGAILLGVPGLATTVYGAAAPVCSGFCLLEPRSGADKASLIAIGLVLVGLATMEAISAVNGFSWASECEAVKSHQLACVSGVETSCASLRSPPPRKGGRDPGEACLQDSDCRSTDHCFRSRCQPRPP